MTALVTDGLTWWARATPDRAAIVFDGHDVVDYRTLDRWSDGAAHYLTARGLRPGDRVGIVGANSLEWCAAALGALKLGAIAVPYNNRFVAGELRHLVESSEPTLVLTDDDRRPHITEALDGSSIGLIALTDFTALREAAHEPVERPAAGPDDLAVIVYTSGTTSKPKGVTYSHRSTFNFIAEFGFTEPAVRPGARMIYLLSMSGAPGLLWHVLHPLTRGLTLYYEKGFEAKTALHRLAAERIQIMAGVPVLFEQMAALPEFAEADLSALELVTIAGARASVLTIQAWLAKGVPLRQAYGMTELSGVSTVNPAEEALRRPESVGRGSVFTRHRVVRPDGTDCAPGEPGEIIVSGPSLTPGYWRDEKATAEAVRDGWFHTGDLGQTDDQGFLQVVDRVKDLIISGGFNIAPSEIEAAITDLDGVGEVCVVSAADERFGETPAAVIHATRPLTAEEVTAHCRSRLAGYKVPRYVVFAAEPLPRMASGKIARRVIRDQYADLASTHPKVG